MRLILAALVILAALPATAQQSARIQTTEIGRVVTAGGTKISLSVTNATGRPEGMMFLVDRLAIQTQAAHMDKSQMLKLRALLDETISELDAASAADTTAR